MILKPVSSTDFGRMHDALGRRRGGLELLAGLADVAGHREHQLAQARVGDGGDDEHLDAARLEVGLDHLGQLAGLGHVGLVEDDDAGALGERAAAEGLVGHVLRELVLDHVEVGHRVAAGLEGRAVDDVHEHRAALDVAQELQARGPCPGSRRG